MSRSISIGMFLSLLFSVLFHSILAIELQPLRPYNGATQLGRRADPAALDLKNGETFFWGSDDASNPILANFTIHMPGAVEKILSMEKFDGMLSSIECDDDGLRLKFQDDATFAYAKRVWDWVNGADDHAFVLVAGAGDCKWNKLRQPFNVTKLKYDEKPNVAHLKATKVAWADLAHSYDLRVGKVAVPDEPAARSLQPRIDLTPEIKGGLAVPFIAAFPFGFTILTEGFKGGIECSTCYTKGHIEFEFILSTFLGIPKGAKVRASPRGVMAETQVKFFGGAEVETKIEKEWPLAKIPIAGVTIGDILALGPNFAINLAAEFGPVSGEVSMTSQNKYTIPDTAYTEIDLLQPQKSRKSSWAPVKSSQPVQWDARIALEGTFFLNPALRISATALKFGWEIGLEGKLPFVKAKIEGNSNPSGATCKNQKYALVVNADFSSGCELDIIAKDKHSGKELIELQLMTIDFPLGSFCKGIGKVGEKPVSKPSTLPSATTGSGPKPTSGTGDKADAPCTAKGGTCKDKSICDGETTVGLCGGGADRQCCTKVTGDVSKCTAKKGVCKNKKFCDGTSTAGLCPGNADIQCCTPKKEDDSKCTSKGGTCLRIVACKGTTTQGLCPGDADIQCCTPKKDPEDKCKAKGGTCLRVSNCKGTSTPGLCPGTPPDVQCCTPKKEPEDQCAAKGGTCLRVMNCKGTSTPSLCPGTPPDVQCCTPKKAEPADKCLAQQGECRSTGSCKSAGGTSTKGLCPGGSDNQCCTYGYCKVGPRAGICQVRSTCKGFSQKGYGCPSSVECCT